MIQDKLRTIFPFGHWNQVKEGKHYTKDDLTRMKPAKKAARFASLIKTSYWPKLVVDCCAGLGGMTVGFSFNRLSIIAFEKNPQCCEMLEKNLKLFRCEKNVTVIAKAFSLDDESLQDALKDPLHPRIVFFFDPPWDTCCLDGRSISSVIEDIRIRIAVCHLPKEKEFEWNSEWYVVIDTITDTKAQWVFIDKDKKKVVQLLQNYLKLGWDFMTDLEEFEKEKKQRMNIESE